MGRNPISNGMMQYSYYAAHMNILFGPEGEKCKERYESICNGMTNPGKFDGVSFMPDGKVVLCIQDFFSSEKMSVKVVEIAKERSSL